MKRTTKQSEQQNLSPDDNDSSRDLCRPSNTPSTLLPKLKRNVSNNGDVYIIALDKDTPGITIDWFLELLTRKKILGGAELEVSLVEGSDDVQTSDRKSRQSTDSKSGLNLDTILIQVSASEERFKEMAVKYSHVFLLGEKGDRESADQGSKSADQDVDACVKHLSNSTKQRLLLKELELLHAVEKESLFGVRDLKLYPGQSIFGACKKAGIITCYFPAHEWSSLKCLQDNWVFAPKTQPIKAIRNYFGETIAFYFAFLDFYTMALIVPSFLGLISYLFASVAPSLVPINCVINALWTVIFIKLWKRRSNTLAFEFGTLEVINYEPARPLFRGKSLGCDPVTGQPCPVYPIMRTWIHEYCVSLPIVGICLYLAIQAMLMYFDIENYVINYYRDSDGKLDSSIMASIMMNLPGIVYAILVSVSNIYYRKLIKILNHAENHRSQSSHENHLLIKLILFEFVNNFGSIFYVAFFIRDIDLLKYQIITMLIVYQALDTIQEVALPLISIYTSKRNIQRMDKKNEISDIISQFLMTEYEDTYFDYLELFIQFGYIFMFSSVFPLAPSLALVNNLIERRSDAFKLCAGHRRPDQRTASGINAAWLRAFEVLGYASIISNCALLAMVHMSTPDGVAKESDTKASLDGLTVESLLKIFGLEHAIFASVLIINYIVQDCPKHVRVASLRKHYLLEQAQLEKK